MRIPHQTSRNPIFKYVLWDRFKGRMILDSDIERMVAQSSTLGDLAFHVLAREKPAMTDGRLEQTAREAIRKYFVLNCPDEA